MQHKNLFLIFCLTFLGFSSTPIQADNHNFLEMFANGAQGVKDFVVALHFLKNLNTDDLDGIIHSSNDIAWDLVVPCLVAAYATYKVSIQPYQPNDNKAWALTKGASVAVGSGLAAYVVGSLPKALIDKLIDKATAMKKGLERSICKKKKK